ncbi:MAG: enoyl-CoA hydratase/isomerase family protein [Leptospiraceae bacterium]|nr:enoyl-CoA hydratase/isomerase family protein [Leptospiraceae bacterium]MCP5495703.1 enoyl-CoA hydratase/isomerase family protein [Leptospiraceae bacterium]
MIEEKQNDYIYELCINTNKKNTMSFKFFQELIKSIDKAESDKNTKIILLSARGNEYFSNGFEPEMFIDKNYDEIYSIVQVAIEATKKVLFFPKIILSLINGHCMGVGSVVATFTDYRIMVDSKIRFGFPESLIGINFPTGACLVLKELIGFQNTRDVLYSGKGLKPHEAVAIGLVDELCEQNDLYETGLKYCKQFKNMAMESIKGIKYSLRKNIVSQISSIESDDIKNLAKAIYSPNGQEGMKSIVEKRKPVFSP